MHELLDGVEKRGLLFLKVLYAEERWWTEKELSTAGKCSSETTFRTITFLKEFSAQTDNFFHIIAKKNKGILLETSPLHSIGEIESHYIKRSLRFKILDALFQKKELNHQRLAKLLFVSPSTIYRRIKKIQLFLEKNGLSLNLTTFSITGPEELVREFFYRIYWSVVKSGQWPFNNFTFQELSAKYDKPLDLLTVKLSKIEKIQFHYRLAINQIRHDAQFYCLGGMTVDTYTQNYETQLEAFVPATLPQAYTKNELTFLTFTLIANANFEEQTDSAKSRIFWHHYHSTEAYAFSDAILAFIKRNCPQNLIKDETRILFKLLSAYYQITLFSQLKLSHTNVAAFIKNFSQENTYFYQLVINSVNKTRHFLSENVLNSNIDYLIYSLLLIFSAEIDVNAMNNRIYVKLSCTVEPLNEEYLKKFLIKKSDQPLTIHTSNSLDIPLNQYDLLITDNLLTEYDYPDAASHYVWDYPPTQRDWKNIVNKIETIASHTLSNI